MKSDPRRTLWSIAVAGTLAIAAPAPGYAQEIAASLSTSPFVTQQTGGDDDSTSGTSTGSSGGGVLIVSAPRDVFLRSTVTDQATAMEAARLVAERSDDPAVRQFAALVQRQSQEMMHDAADIAARNGVDVQLAPTAPDETALIAELSRLTGRDLDETYLRAFIQDQRVAITDYLSARATMSDDVSAYADRHLGMLSDQLRAAQELAMRLGINIEER